MKRFFFTLIASVSILGMTSCVYVNPNLGNQTSPETVKEVRAVPLKQMSGFTAIATKQAIKTAYTQAGKPSIKVKSNIKDPNLLDIRVDDKKLIIGYKPTLSSIDGNLKTFVEISGYDVNEFEVSSAEKSPLILPTLRMENWNLKPLVVATSLSRTLRPRS